MRLVISFTALALLTACQVTKDNANNSVSVTYNSDVAENAAADVGNTAKNVAADIGSDVKNTGDKIENRVGDRDVNVKVTTSDNDDKTANKQ